MSEEHERTRAELKRRREKQGERGRREGKKIGQVGHEKVEEGLPERDALGEDEEVNMKQEQSIVKPMA